MLVKRHFDSRRAMRRIRRSRARSSVHVRSQIVQVAPQTPRLPVKSVYIARVNYYLPASLSTDSGLGALPNNEIMPTSTSKDSLLNASKSEDKTERRLHSLPEPLNSQHSVALLSLPSLSSMLGEFTAYAEAITSEVPELSGQARRSSTCILTTNNTRLSSMEFMDSKRTLSVASTTAIDLKGEVQASMDNAREPPSGPSLVSSDKQSEEDTSDPLRNRSLALRSDLTVVSQHRTSEVIAAESVEGACITTCSFDPEVCVATEEGTTVNISDVQGKLDVRSDYEGMHGYSSIPDIASQELIPLSENEPSISPDGTLSLSTLGSLLGARLNEFPSVPSFLPVNTTDKSSSGLRMHSVDSYQVVRLSRRSSNSLASSLASLPQSISMPAALDSSDSEARLGKYPLGSFLLSHDTLSASFRYFLSNCSYSQQGGCRYHALLPTTSNRGDHEPGDLWDEEDEALVASAYVFCEPNPKEKNTTSANRGRHTWTAGMTPLILVAQPSIPFNFPTQSQGLHNESRLPREEEPGELWDDEDERRFSATSHLSTGMPLLSASATTASSSSLSSDGVHSRRGTYRRSLRNSAMATLASLEGTLKLSVSLSGEYCGLKGKRMSFFHSETLSLLTSLQGLDAHLEESEDRQSAWVEEIEDREDNAGDSQVDLESMGSVNDNVSEEIWSSVNFESTKLLSPVVEGDVEVEDRTDLPNTLNTGLHTSQSGEGSNRSLRELLQLLDAEFSSQQLMTVEHPDEGSSSAEVLNDPFCNNLWTLDLQNIIEDSVAMDSPLDVKEGYDTSKSGHDDRFDGSESLLFERDEVIANVDEKDIRYAAPCTAHFPSSGDVDSLDHEEENSFLNSMLSGIVSVADLQESVNLT